LPSTASTPSDFTRAVTADAFSDRPRAIGRESVGCTHWSGGTGSASHAATRGVRGGPVKRVHRLWLLLPLSLALSACDEKLSTLAGPTPDLQPTFASVQTNVFEKTDSAGRPACVNCHTNTGRTPSGGMNLNHDVAYDQL